jgi:hypothetical protein
MVSTKGISRAKGKKKNKKNNKMTNLGEFLL